MDDLVRFALPPVLGALIGYVTNAIAIKMLFRPLREYRVFGIRIPFTPGVIPRRREGLAESIGRMVSEKLLTKDAVLAKVDSPDFQAGLHGSVSSFTEEVLSRPLSTTAGEFAGASQGISKALTGFLSSFLRSKAAGDVIATVVREAVLGVADLRWRDILNDPGRAREIIVDLEVWKADHLQRTVTDFLDRHESAGTTFDGVLTDQALEGIKALLVRLYDPTLERLMRWLRSEDIRSELIIRGRVVLERILSKLNVFQRFLVTATQYERSLRDRMPAIIDDLTDTLDRTLQEPRNRDRIVNALMDVLRDIRSRQVVSVLLQKDEGKGRAAARISRSLAEVLERFTIPEELGALGERFLRANSEGRLEDAARSLSGLGPDAIADRVVTLVSEWLEVSGGADVVAGRVVTLGVGFFSGGDKPLNRILQIDGDAKEKLDEFVTRRLSAILVRKTPELVEALDVRKLVEDKINSLDVESVEKLLLMVIAKHLKWINVFGALVGALVGGVQVLIGLLTS